MARWAGVVADGGGGGGEKMGEEIYSRKERLCNFLKTSSHWSPHGGAVVNESD